MTNKYPLVNGDYYTDVVNNYLERVAETRSWSKNHRLEIEPWMEEMQEKRSKEQNDF